MHVIQVTQTLPHMCDRGRVGRQGKGTLGLPAHGLVGGMRTQVAHRSQAAEGRMLVDAQLVGSQAC
jgi:hypothetical protein